MSQFERGTVKAITFDVEYPDGTTKRTRIDDARSIGAIVMHESQVPPEHKDLFNVSESNWRENPAMLVMGPYLEEGGGLLKAMCSYTLCGD